MLVTRPFINVMSKTLNLAASEVKYGRFDTASFFSSLSTSRFEISNGEKCKKSENLPYLILDRCEVLYCTAYSAFCKLQTSMQDRYDIYCAAEKIALRSLELFDSFGANGDAISLKAEADRILKDAEGFLSHSVIYRRNAVSRHRRLGSALVEVEYICSCSELAVRSARLIYAYFELL